MSEASGAEGSEPTSAKTSRALEIAIAVCALVAATVLLYLTRQINVRQQLEGSIGPQWWPQQIALAILALSVLLLAIAVTRPPFDRSDMGAANRVGWIRMTATILLTGVYFWAWPAFGFIAVTIIYLAALIALYGARSWKALIGYPVGVTALLYVLFHYLLRVPL